MNNISTLTSISGRKTEIGSRFFNLINRIKLDETIHYTKETCDNITKNRIENDKKLINGGASFKQGDFTVYFEPTNEQMDLILDEGNNINKVIDIVKKIKGAKEDFDKKNNIGLKLCENNIYSRDIGKSVIIQRKNKDFENDWKIVEMYEDQRGQIIVQCMKSDNESFKFIKYNDLKNIKEKITEISINKNSKDFYSIPRTFNEWIILYNKLAGFELLKLWSFNNSSNFNNNFDINKKIKFDEYLDIFNSYTGCLENINIIYLIDNGIKNILNGK